MSMTDEERSILVRLELEKAHDTFEEIEILRQAGKWNGAANRVYYFSMLSMHCLSMMACNPVVIRLLMHFSACIILRQVNYRLIMDDSIITSRL